MRHISFRRPAAFVLALLMCLGMVAATVAVILPMLPVSAAEESVAGKAPSGTVLVSKDSVVTLSVCTNERAGSENSYEMPSEKWAKKFLVDGMIGTGGWSCQPYDREMNAKEPVTVTLKLPSEADVTAVSLFPNGQFPNTYEIQVSTDGINFKKVASDSGVAPGNKNVKTYTFATEKATHVRLHITDRNPATGPDGALAQLGEIAVWGKAKASMTLDRTALELLVGESDTLTPSFVGVSGKPSVTYESTDASVASVDKNGKVTAKKLGKTTITATASSVGLSATCTVEVVEKKHDFNENINISIFWPPTPDYINDEQYKLIADAGVNWVMGAGEETLATVENQAKMLELCQKYGLGMTVSDGYFGDHLLGKTEEQIAGYVKKYQNVPSAYGFYLRDEPFNPNAYVDAYVAIKKAAPEASVHLNFLPLGSYGTEYTYKAQMTDWCRLTAAAGYPIEYLMFDQYPFSLHGNGMNRAGFFQNTRAVWEVGLSEGVKTGMYIQTVQQDVAFRRPSASEIRYEMYAALAFGYKQLSFFTWFTPVNRSEPFSDGIISADGKPNSHYYDIKKINHEILAIGNILVQCDALEVYFNGADTYGQPSVPDDFFVKADKSDSVILSYLRHKETGRGYLMVVNNNYSAKQEIQLTFDKTIKSISEVSRTDGSLKALSMDGQTLKLTLAAGDAMFIALPEDFDRLKKDEGQPVATENLAAIDGAIILCPTSAGSDGWYMYNLNDGIRITGGDSSANGWRSTDYNDTYILIDLGRKLDFNRIDLYACGTIFDYGQFFPKNIKVSVSDDGKSFAEVKSFTDLTPAKLQGNKLTFERQNARYIRLDITGMSRKDRYAALNEIEVYNDDGSVPAPRKFTLTESNGVVDYKDGENIALNKEAFASSTTPGSYEQWGWALRFINDGRKKVGQYTAGWTSNVGRNPTADATEYVGIDFGDVFALDRVVIQPHGAFPVDYTIDVSTDGVEWTVISKVKGASAPKDDLVLNLDEPVPARFLRMTATKLTSGGSAADGYLFQLGEIEAYGKPICDKTALQAAVETYKSEGGDSAAKLYTDAVAALENALLTQSRANDYVTKLLAAVGKTPETDPPETDPVDPPVSDTEPATETDPVTDPATESDITPETDPGTADPDTAMTVGSTPAETDPAAKRRGCASTLGASAVLLLFAAGAVISRKKRN